MGLLGIFVLYFFNTIPYTLLAIRTAGELMWQQSLEEIENLSPY